LFGDEYLAYKRRVSMLLPWRPTVSSGPSVGSGERKQPI
jgi:hypothetical protein